MSLFSSLPSLAWAPLLANHREKFGYCQVALAHTEPYLRLFKKNVLKSFFEILHVLHKQLPYLFVQRYKKIAKEEDFYWCGIHKLPERWENV